MVMSHPIIEASREVLISAGCLPPLFNALGVALQSPTPAELSDSVLDALSVLSSSRMVIFIALVLCL